MNKVKNICHELDCTGCSLCENMCPVDAISMKANHDFGHIRPVINQDLCIGCQLCQKNCPANHSVELNSIKECYAAWQTDDKKHYSSSSGGIASALYERTIQNGGYIVGVKYANDFEPEFILSNSMDSIADFKKSKYIQPKMNGVYKDVVQKLKEGKEVTFVGLPCHCAALRNAVKNMKHSNLLIVDVVCHGVPAFQSIHEHIQHIENQANRTAKHISFRDKRVGEVLELLDERDTFYKRCLHEDTFMHAFISNDIFAENCYRCKYACSQRVGDLTICDFWGLGKEIPFKHKATRISAILINNDKGQKAFESIQDLIAFEKRPIDEAVKGNSQLMAPSFKGRNRDLLIEYARKNQFEMGLQTVYGKEADKIYRTRVIKESVKKPVKNLLRLVKR